MNRKYFKINERCKCIMNNKVQQQLIDLYMNKCTNSYPSLQVNTLESIDINDTGFLKLNITDKVIKKSVLNATITLYVTDGTNRDIPIMHIITTLNPIRLELPMANVIGTQLVGPEYNFSTYNLRIDVFGYFSRNIYNIRLFPDTTTNFDVELIPVTHIEAQPLIEERFDIPPHPRDVIN